MLKGLFVGEVMKEALKRRLLGCGDYFPSVVDYTELLDIAQKKFKIKDRDVAREKYGNKSYAEWRKILGV